MEDFSKLTLEELNEKKIERRKIEISHSKFISQFDKERMLRYEFADLQLNVQSVQNHNDVLDLQNQFLEWLIPLEKKVNRSEKDNTNRINLYNLYEKTYRIDMYSRNLENSIRTSIMQLKEEKDYNLNLLRKINSLESEILSIKTNSENEIKSLKAEIEFINSGHN